MNETIRNKVSSSSRPQTMCLRVGRLLLRNILGFRRIRQIHTSFFINLSIIQFGSDCHAYCIKCIAAANQYKKFNPCHSYKKVDNKGHSLSRPQTMCLRVCRFLLHNTLGFRRIRRTHTSLA